MMSIFLSKTSRIVFILATALFFAGCNAAPPPAEEASPSSDPLPVVTAVQTEETWVSFTTGANIKALELDGNQLWMGLSSGMIRYDTETSDNHEVYTTASTNGGLLSKGIYTIKVDQNGTKWIGSYGGGLTLYDGKTWKTYTVADGLGDQWVYDIVFYEGKAWIATWKGVSVFDGKKFKNYTEKDGLIDKWVYAIALDQENVFWFGTESGVNRFDGKTWSSYTHEDGLGAAVAPSGNPDETAAESPASGLPSLGEMDYGSTGSRSVAHHASPSKKNIGANPNFVITAAVDRENAKWFGTWGAGLSRFDGKTWTTFTKEDGLGGNFIHIVEVDSEGRVWAGTNGGISWYDGIRWRNFSTEDGLLDNNVFSIAFGKNGDRWFGTWQGLSRHRGDLPI